jgi:hypothetical protein
LEPLQDFGAQRVLADARNHATARAQRPSVEGKIGGRAAQLFARGKDVPKNFSDANYAETHPVMPGI